MSAGSRELAVAAAGAVPGKNVATVALPALAAEPPVGEASAAPDGGIRVRIWPSAAAATVVVSAGGRELARRSVPALGGMPWHALDLAVAPRASETALWIAEERADGVRSAWRRLERPQPADEIQPAVSIP